VPSISTKKTAFRALVRGNHHPLHQPSEGFPERLALLTIPKVGREGLTLGPPEGFGIGMGGNGPQRWLFVLSPNIGPLCFKSIELGFDGEIIETSGRPCSD